MKSTEQVILDTLGKETCLPTSKVVEVVLGENSERKKEEVLQSLTQLYVDGKLSLTPPRFSKFKSFFFDTAWNTSFWAVMVACAGYAVQFWMPSQPPWGLLRLPPGLLLLFYLPGRSLLRVIVNSNEPSFLRKYVLEIALSLVLAMLLGLVLNFTPGSLLTAKGQVSLVGLNLVLAFAASFTDYRQKYSARLG